MRLFALGLNHRTAPIEVRERVAFPVGEQGSAVDALKRYTMADEAMLVSTCNRTELYLRAANDEVLGRATNWLSQLPAVEDRALTPHLYTLADSAVPRHAFRVASGLDSMVLGEPQILGQVKQAVRVATDAHALAGPLDRLFQETFSVAKEVRTQTELGNTVVSLPSISARLAQQLFADTSHCRLLLIGAGEMIDVAATYFAALRPTEIVIANRSIERGRALADRLGGRAIPLLELPDRIHQFDIVVTCTASTLPIIGKGMIERALMLRKRRPMFIVDLAVPRDVEAGVGLLNDVYLHTLDTLGKIAAVNTSHREAAVEKAEHIIDQRTSSFMQWLDGRRMVPAICRLREKAARDSEHELSRAKRSLLRGDPPVLVLEALAQSLTNKFLHNPMSALHDCSSVERETLLAAVRKLYLDEK
jgi:glutamyl-tRNA reductase